MNVYTVMYVGSNGDDTELIGLAKTIQGARNIALRFMDDFRFEILDEEETPEDLVVHAYMVSNGNIVIQVMEVED